MTRDRGTRLGGAFHAGCVRDSRGLADLRSPDRAIEVPGRAVLTLQYVLLAGLLVGIAGAVFNLLRAE
jgi:hypothetical protein